jgi:hypothetical protein
LKVVWIRGYRLVTSVIGYRLATKAMGYRLAMWVIGYRSVDSATDSQIGYKEFICTD